MTLEYAMTGFDRLQAKLALLAEPDAEPLMLAWRQIIEDDNRDGVLAGLDGEGVPMVETVRERTPKLREKFGSGPPLAPKYADSRVIKNLVTEHLYDQASGTWHAIGAWQSVNSARGDDFLKYHFSDQPRKMRKDGSGPILPRRDLRGLRPVGLARVEVALHTWAESLLRIV